MAILKCTDGVFRNSDWIRVCLGAQGGERRRGGNYEKKIFTEHVITFTGLDRSVRAPVTTMNKDYGTDARLMNRFWKSKSNNKIERAG